MTTLRSANLLLRPMSRADIPRQREFFRDAELAELDSSSPDAYAKIDVEEFFETWTANDESRAPFAIEVDSRYIGYCTLMHLTNSNGVFELGINIGDRRYWNQGYGKEVVKLLLYHGFHQLGGQRIELTTHQKNGRAIGCFLACGFREDKRIREAVVFDGQHVDMIEMSITRERWELLNTQG